MEYFESKNQIKFRGDPETKKAFKKMPDGSEVEVKLPNDVFADAMAYGFKITEEEYSAS